MPLRPTLLRTLLPLLALLALACGEESTAPRVTSVEVTPASATLVEMGATQQFSARALDADGEPVTGEQVSWSSDDQAVATVSSSGLATAVGTGVATITATATSAGVSGTALLTVLEPDPECVDPQTVTLAAGEHAVFGSQECFVLPAGAQGDLYRVVVMRPDSAAASSVPTATLTLSGLGQGQVAGAPRSDATSPASAPSTRLTEGALRELGRSLRMAASTERFHARLRASEGREIPEALGAGARMAEPSPAPAQVGLQAALQSAPEKIRLDPRTSCSHTEREEVTGILVHESAELAIYQDSAQRSSSPVAKEHVRQMADYYFAHGKEVIESYFGVPSDLDGNGRMVVLVSPAVSDDQVAAFVWSGDFLERGGSSCPAANGGEYIFFNNSLIGRIEDENYQALETLVHEVKHVVSLRNRLRASINAGGVSRFHPLWVEEGTAEIAGNLSSRVALETQGRVGVGDRLDVEDLVNGEGQLERTPENYGVLLRMLRTVRYLASQPNGVVLKPDGAHRDHSIYGTGWHFHRWLGDAYGNAEVARSDSSLFRALSDSLVAPGPAGLQEITGRSFKELFEEYARAVAVHGTGAPQGTRPITSYDFVSATDILCRPGSGNGCPAGADPQPDGLYPWPVTERSGEPGTTLPAPLASGEFAGPLGPTGIRIHDFESAGVDAVQVDLSLGAPGKILVLRLR